MKRIILATTFLFFCSAASYAEPTQGWSIHAGFATHDATFAGFNYGSTGMSLGGDYQIAVAPEWSVNILFLSSAENGSGDLTGISVGHGMFGLEGRYWVDNVFFGAHFGHYSEVLSDGWISSSATGFGYGFSAGIEYDQGLFLMGQYDTAQINYAGDTVDLDGFRFSIGYRWHY